MDINTILIKIKNSINIARNKEVKYFNLYELYNLYQCDIIINSWRDLSTINNIYNLTMNRYENKILDKNKILNFLKSNRKRKILYLDYYDNNYVINKIDHID